MAKLFFLSLFIPAFAFSQADRAKIYPFKSAIIKYKYEATFSGAHIKYIDDYGYKQTDFIKRKQGDSEEKNETILLIGNKAYTINWQDSTVAVGLNSTYAYYQNHPEKSGIEVSEALLQKVYGYVLKGKESYLKNKCQVWQTKGGKMLTWNGLMLSAKTTVFTMNVEKAETVKINKKLPQNIFDIPAGLTYISSDVYQGFGGLEPLFGKVDTLTKEETGTNIEFNSSSLAPSNEFAYFTSNGKAIILKGANDFNKVDLPIIKSQVYAMGTAEVELPRYSTFIFKTSNGNYGKLQLNDEVEAVHSVRYMLFDEKGKVVAFSAKELSSFLTDFKFEFENNKLKITLKNGDKGLVLGW